ncbi:MAG: hypothetical protein MZV70_37080 [Desulfobacterales bacterium]|nr:hypothetical protein [Desulfobacterales bacterium]
MDVNDLPPPGAGGAQNPGCPHRGGHAERLHAVRDTSRSGRRRYRSGGERDDEDLSQAGLSIVLTQDWHPEGHRPFASAHAGKKPYDLYDESGIGPVLWPDHRVQGTPGADFHPGLDVKLCHAIIRKGFRPHVDSYSGFLENDRQTRTGLHGYLKGRGMQDTGVRACNGLLRFLHRIRRGGSGV